MQSIPLPAGEGRWALNLEAQKKDSLFYKMLQMVIKDGGQFAPMIGLPGIAMSALQSFNVLYGAIHTKPVSIIQSHPIPVFATQDAYGAQGSGSAATGVMLRSGTYVLLPASQMPADGDLNQLSLIQGRIVPPKTAIQDLDSAAADTLRSVTYVTFDVQVSSTQIIRGPSATGKQG